MTLLAAWADLDAGERQARLRCLQGLVRLLAGPRCELVALLRQAETDPALLPDCDFAMRVIGTVAQRRILATFAPTLPTKTEVVASLRAEISPQETPSTVAPLPRRGKRQMQGR